MNKKSKLIHQESILKIDNLIPILLLLIVWVFFFKTLKDDLWIIIYTAFMVIACVFLIRRRSTFSVYDDRIELFKSFSKKLISEIKFSQIDQVRYEDGFSGSYGYFWSKYLIIYLKRETSISQKKDQLTLGISGFNRIKNISKLLKFFKSKNLEVMVKTKSKRILRETGLKNWDLS